MNEALDLLHEHGIIDSETADLVITTQRSFGGGFLRTLERVLPDIEQVWAAASALIGRPHYRTLSTLETLEEVVGGDQTPEPLLGRELALDHQILGHRREWTTLCLLAVDPLQTAPSPALLERAHRVSPTAEGQIRYATLTPALYRRCVQLIYPEALYGPLPLYAQMAVAGLLPTTKLRAVLGQEHRAVEQGLLAEDDYAACLAAHMRLPRYDFTPISAPWKVLPRHIIHEFGIAPHSVQGSTLHVLTYRLLSDEQTRELERLSGCAVTYQIATPTEIATLSRKEDPAYA